ncbi:hypothetical protein BOX15_Mlig017485g1 [Macrostomum lignano]|uniref:Mothers against decapentaplegic homolog n=1 Tax=Macrostomum lignano TaxID=282301 RepID=A0A267F245_9PLAT|nr:hypothetical protein BOX15_Mlig017485g1 [Macrostomum lignano]
MPAAAAQCRARSWSSSWLKRLRRPELVKALERAVSEAARIPDASQLRLLRATGAGHVTACRLWRWPDLQSAQELRPLENCQMPYTARTQTELCVNPQHYTRLPLCSPAQDPVLVCRPGTPAGSSGVGMGSASSAGGPADDPNAASPSVYMSEDNDGAGSEGGRIGALSPPQQQLPARCSSSRSSRCTACTTPSLSTGAPFTTMSWRQGRRRLPCLLPVHHRGRRHGPERPERFCLGLLSNVNRSLTVEQTRRSIGSGVGLYYVNGEVHVECLSDSPIFVQSPNGNLRQNWHAATVCRIPPGCNLCVFSNADFGSQLRQSAQQGFDEVYALTKMCTIRIAFVKGWGSDYRRQLVTATPCWIEVHLNGPLLWLDQVLAAMGSPTYVCSSMS